MKNLILLCAIMYATSSFAQKSPRNKLSKKAVHNNANSFSPPIKLLNKEIWHRVSPTRFECEYLRLAVEYQDFEYVLYEMDGEKRELSRAREYSTIGKEIAFNTFRVSPNYIDANKLTKGAASSQ